MSPFIYTLLISALGIFIYMNFWFVTSLIKRRNDIADIAWGLGFIFVTLLGLCANRNFGNRQLFLGAIVIAWGMRLAYHIYSRNKHKTEDFRYKKWREEWGKFFLLRSYLQVFILQGVFMFLISTPISAVLSSPYSGMNLINIVGLFIWLIGFYFESVGDLQLAQFLAAPENKDKIMTTGLWKYTRHPNYFGEVTQWWGVLLVSLGTSHPLLLLVSPVTITFLILKVSGIPMLEKKYEGNTEFEEYKQKTSAFFPLPPKTIHH